MKWLHMPEYPIKEGFWPSIFSLSAMAEFDALE